jgi:hypothetical protein
MQIVAALDYKNTVLHLYCIAKTPDQDGRSPEGLVNEPLLFDPRNSCFAGLSGVATPRKQESTGAKDAKPITLHAE